MILVFILILLFNIFTFLLYAYDKKCARSGKWRVSEFTLMMCAILGGSLGAYIAVYSLHHKTKHSKFYIGIPIILSIHILLLIINL